VSEEGAYKGDKKSKKEVGDEKTSSGNDYKISDCSKRRDDTGAQVGEYAAGRE